MRARTRLHRVVLVVDRRGGAREVVDLVHLQVEREGDVVPDDLEVGAADQVGDVALAAGVEVVAADDVAALLQQALAEKGAQEPGAARDQDAFAKMHGDPFVDGRSAGFIARPALTDNDARRGGKRDKRFRVRGSGGRQKSGVDPRVLIFLNPEP
jgi:hypothetical protein